MFKNYIKIALRNITRNKIFAGINIIGLAIGIATCLIIMLFVQHEWSYDRYNEKADRMVRVVVEGVIKGEPLKEANVMPPVAQTMLEEFPEVEDATRLRQWGTPLVTYQNQSFKNHDAAFVDDNFFSVFTLPLIKGDKGTALTQPNAVVISEAVADKFFGNTNPVGETLTLANWGSPFKVTGVITDVPENSHFDIDIFLSMASFPDARNPSWMVSEFYTYLVLQKGASYKDLEAKLPAFFEQHAGSQIQKATGMTLADFTGGKGNYFGLQLQPLTDIHLKSDFAFDLAPYGDIRYVYMFAAIALFMLLIACINFMNLSTAGASKRAKEVGVRKVVGSGKWELIRQFLSESVLMASVSLLLALLLVKLALPVFNEIADKNLEFQLFGNAWLLPSLLLFGLLVGILAGSYPAFFLSSFRPKTVLKGDFSGSKKSGGLRSGLVIFQFLLTIVLIISTVVVYQQLQFIQDTKLGYDTDSILVVPNLWALKDKENAFKQKIEQDPRIENASYSGYLPVGNSFNNNFFLAPKEDESKIIKTLRYDVDEAYIPTLGIEMSAGRNFSKAFSTDSSGLILNEAAVRAFGWQDNALDQTLVYTNNEGQKTNYQVIGVVEDFHFKPLHERISPLVMRLETNSGAAIMKVKTSDVSGLLADLKTTWTNFTNEEPFNPSFFDERIYETYKAERKVGTILSIFAALTIFVACLGLFGLTIFTAEQRRKEIGIRKVLGASVGNVVGLLSKDFLKLILVAYILACPLAWWLMSQWLQDFAYSINMGWWIFMISGVAAISIALLTVSFQSVKAALADPVESLRNE